MIDYLYKKVLGALSFGLFAGLILSAFFWARAVTPGAIQNPTFGPTDTDVVTSFGVSCDWTGWHGWGGHPNGVSGYNTYNIGDYAHQTAFGLSGFCESGILKEIKWLEVYYR